MKAIIFGGNFIVTGKFSRGVIFSSEAIILGGNCLGANYSEGAIIQGKIIRGQFSTRANVLEPADREKILREINSLDHTKVCQEYDISTKVIKEDAEIVSEILHLSFNVSVNQGTFPSVFKITG